MDEIWDRIETWLAKNAPAVLAGLNGPASEQELDATERALGVTLPEDVRASYRRHNGQAGAEDLFPDGEFLSLEGVRFQWGTWKELLDRGEFFGIDSNSDGREVRTDWWHPAWVPFTYNGCGDHVCIDLAPGPEGEVGQIIEMWHDDGERPLEANSFREWLLDFAEALESDELGYSEEYGGIVWSQDV
jgi:cell wall assembly regulator SMI1